MTATFNAIGLVETDMAASLACYRRLGRDSPAGQDDQPHAEAALPGGFKLMWDSVQTVRMTDPDWTPTTGSRWMSLAFQCGSPAEVDKTYAELIEAGHSGFKAPWDAFWGQRYAIVHDPDGNEVALYAAR